MDKILLGHGSGGKLTHDLIDGLFLKKLGNSVANKKNDSALISLKSKKLAYTTDSFVVKPLFFAGGDIGSLAVHGTVNDLAVCGAKPLYISLGMIIEEGLEMKALERITDSIAKAVKEAGIFVATGDVKVVEKGSCDKIFISASGIGEVYYEKLSIDSIRKGDAVIVSGPIGDHAISVISKREGIEFSSTVKSDSAPLNSLIAKVLKVSGRVKFMRDPTRGGLATTLNEIVKKKGFGIALDEARIPVRAGVREACELLGFDPLYLACEGRVIVIVDPKDEKKVLGVIRRDRHGRGAAIVGRIVGDHHGKVFVKTVSGGKRLVDMLPGEQLPRIC